MWGAADILRGSLDPADYRQPVMTLLFLKRLNDTFEENAEKLIQEGKSKKDHYCFYDNAIRYNVQRCRHNPMIKPLKFDKLQITDPQLYNEIKSKMDMENTDKRKLMVISHYESIEPKVYFS